MRRVPKQVATRLASQIANEQGFTLIELLVAMALAVGVLGAGIFGLSGAFRQSTEVTDRVQTTDNAEVQIQRLTSDIRQAVPCPSGLQDANGHPLGGGIYVGLGPTIEICDPVPGTHSSQPAPEGLVVWTCAGAVTIYNTSLSAQTCSRSWAPVTVTSSTTATLGASNLTAQLYGVKSLTLSGETGNGTGTTGAAVAGLAAKAYSLSSPTGISWLGVQAQFYNLVDPSNPADPQNTDITNKTSAISLATGASFRNYDT